MVKVVISPPYKRLDCSKNMASIQPKAISFAPVGLLKKTTVNRYLKQWGYDKERLSRQPIAVRFEAELSNQCWHFDLSPSDLKRLKNAVELEPGRGKPLLMLYSVVDDRSGVAYQEYHEVYGEDVGAALKFLFNAMSGKNSYIISLPGNSQDALHGQWSD